MSSQTEANMRASQVMGTVSFTFVWLLAACGTAPKRQAAAITGGDPDRGAATISHYGCGSCHAIPGIAGANGLVGPPLGGIGNREYVVGMLPNQTVNLMHWVQDPRSVNERTVMPNLGVTPGDASDIAPYLYSLK
jgi:cytochrome c